MRQLGLFSIIVGEVIAGTELGLGLTYWAVSRWGWPGWTMPVGAMAGLVGAFLQIVQQVRRTEKDKGD